MGAIPPTCTAAPVAQTVADTWAWLTTTPAPLPSGGLGPRLEAALLNAADRR
ncbi:hypothetical protein Cme02nite_06920 [Catellatospora methionotrophica]|uniref:Uncharacterized protein n=1 Tax=Catellatospora methionotrophica TaxID=121620 RepID=A0A8J3LGU3_9ACTN|nr:hypothetical protein [Catellatospora methionotrophica]GIG12360.1 hypothetical protein Cme02nite_06920 [Catellatospora methionotrophica]